MPTSLRVLKEKDAGHHRRRNQCSSLPTLRILSCVLFLLLQFNSVAVVAGAEEAADTAGLTAADNAHAEETTLLLEPWQECSIFIAPSWSGGNGVFAARDFTKGEIVELAPFFLAVDHGAPAILNSALHDYVYGYSRFVEEEVIDDDHQQQQQNTTTKRLQLSAIVWGMSMWYNHHPTSPNVAWTVLGGEPHPHHYHTDTLVQAVGFVARRDIQAGEELLSSYGEEDGGTKWFRDRHLEMVAAAAPEQLQLVVDGGDRPQQLNHYKQTYCSKMYAGMDRWVYQHRLRVHQPEDYPHGIALERLVPPPPSAATSSHRRLKHYYNNPDYPWAIAKVPIAAGDRIELAPALVMHRALVDRSPLAPLVYYWDDLNDDLQHSVRELRQQGYYAVQFQGQSNQWHREDRFTELEDSVILPVAGWIGRVQRVGNHEDDDSRRANCYMKIHATTYEPSNSSNAEKQSPNDLFLTGNAGIMLELIATRDIAVGERIQIDLPSAGTLHERILLYQEMQRSGQIYALPPTPSIWATQDKEEEEEAIIPTEEEEEEEAAIGDNEENEIEHAEREQADGNDEQGEEQDITDNLVDNEIEAEREDDVSDSEEEEGHDDVTSNAVNHPDDDEQLENDTDVVEGEDEHEHELAEHREEGEEIEGNADAPKEDENDEL